MQRVSLGMNGSERSLPLAAVWLILGPSRNSVTLVPYNNLWRRRESQRQQHDVGNHICIYCIWDRFRPSLPFGPKYNFPKVGTQ